MQSAVCLARLYSRTLFLCSLFCSFRLNLAVQYVITEILAHRMLAVHCNGLNGKSSLRSLLRDIFPVYFYILGLKISYKVYFCHTDCYLGIQNCNGMWCKLTCQYTSFGLFFICSQLLLLLCAMGAKPQKFKPMIKLNHNIFIEICMGHFGRWDLNWNNNGFPILHLLTVRVQLLKSLHVEGSSVTLNEVGNVVLSKTIQIRNVFFALPKLNAGIMLHLPHD